MSLPKLKRPLIFRLPTADSGCKQYLNGTARVHFLNLKFRVDFSKSTACISEKYSSLCSANSS